MSSASLDGLRICEIGVGYGGQARIISTFCNPSSYTLVDLRAALALAQRYLDNFPLLTTLAFATSNELALETFDLVISNYAFTELRREVQDVYMSKIIRRAKRGYITWNDIAPDDFQSMELDELLGAIPGAKAVDEFPLTYRGNKIVTWGQAS